MDFLNLFFRSLIIGLIISFGALSTSTAQLYDNVDTHVRVKPRKVKLTLDNNTTKRARVDFELIAVNDLDDIQMLVDEGVIIYQDDVLVADEGVIIHQDDVLRVDEGVIIHQDDVLSVDEGVIIHQDDVLSVDEGVIIHQDDVLRVAQGSTVIRRNRSKSINIFLGNNHDYVFYVVVFKLHGNNNGGGDNGGDDDGDGGSSKTISNAPSLIKSQLNTDLVVYPNPTTSGNFMVDFPEMETDCVLNIYDTDGRLLHTNTVNKNTVQQAIQMSQLVAGKYLITLEGKQGQYSQWMMVTQ